MPETTDANREAVQQRAESLAPPGIESVDGNDRQPDGNTSVTSPAADELAVLAKVFECEVQQDLLSLRPDADFLKRFGIAYARSHCVIGFQRDDQLLVAICNRDGYDHLDIIGRALHRNAQPFLATEAAIQKMINVAYADRSSQAPAR